MSADKLAQSLGPDEFIGTAIINGHLYTGRRMIRVARVTVDRSTCVVPLSTLADTIDGGGKYVVEVGEMRKAEFDRMEEFQGW
jgi:hypothetical protein